MVAGHCDNMVLSTYRHCMHDYICPLCGWRPEHSQQLNVFAKINDFQIVSKSKISKYNIGFYSVAVADIFLEIYLKVTATCHELQI